MGTLFTAIIKPSYLTFTMNENEDILSAAKRQGINLPYSCSNGTCSACKVQMTTGKVEHSAYDRQYALKDSEAASGQILTCCATAKSDIVIELPNFTAEDLKQQMVKMKICHLEYIHDVAIVRLAFPKNESFIFEAGQFVDVVLQNNQTRSYSIANAFVEDVSFIELHIRAQAKGVFSQYVFNYMAVGHTVQVRGALGSFKLQANPSSKPIIFLASGTGFAPIKSMIETLIKQEKLAQPIYFYWGARKKDDLYMLEKAISYMASFPQYTFIPVLSDALPQDAWKGRTGLVHEAVLHDFDDLINYEVYACGAPAMVQAAACDLVKQRNLPETSFYSDAFVAACK